MAERRAFCTCMHSYWSHRTSFGYDDRRLATRCERQGCRCEDYSPAPVADPDDTKDGQR